MELKYHKVSNKHYDWMIKQSTYQKDVMNLEIKALNDMECFEYRDERDKIDDGYQFTRLHMVFEAKQDHPQKARLVAGGHLIELLKSEVYSSAVK